MDKLIVNNKSFIINLCKRLLNLEISEYNFKIGYYDDDDDLYFVYLGQEYLIRFDQVYEKYLLLHKNKAGSSRNSHSYHSEMSELSLITLISKLSTRHNPVDMNNKKSKLNSLFEQIETNRKIADESQERRQKLLDEIHEYHETKKT